MSAKIEELKAKILAIDPDEDVSRPTSYRPVLCSNGQDAEQLMFVNGINTVGDMRRFIENQDDNDLITFELDYDDYGTLVTIEEEYEYSDEKYVAYLQEMFELLSSGTSMPVSLPSGRIIYLSDADKAYLKGL